MDKLKDFVNNLKTALDIEDGDIPLIPTGIDIYDIFSGGGLPLGEFILVIGDPGAGKTTVFLNLIGKIQQTLNSIAFLIDAERSISKNRRDSLGIIDELTIHKQVGITLESLFKKDLAQMVLFKEKSKTDSEIPLYVLWDSIATTPVESSSEDVAHEALTKAKLLPMFLRKTHESLIRHKITLIAINHITDKVKMSMYEKDDSIIPGLRGKSLPGGRYQIYSAYQLPHISKVQELDPNIYGFKGYLAEIIFRKNKAAIPFQPFQLVIDYTKGVNNFWTNFHYLKMSNQIKVAGGWLSLQGYDGKFRQKEAPVKYNTDPVFKEVFDIEFNKLKNELHKLVGMGAHVDTEQFETAKEDLKQMEETTTKG